MLECYGDVIKYACGGRFVQTAFSAEPRPPFLCKLRLHEKALCIDAILYYSTGSENMQHHCFVEATSRTDSRNHSKKARLTVTRAHYDSALNARCMVLLTPSYKLAGPENVTKACRTTARLALPQPACSRQEPARQVNRSDPRAAQRQAIEHMLVHRLK